VTSDAGVPAVDDSLPPAHFAFPGPLRDRLVGAILAGRKLSTTGLLVEYELEGSVPPDVGHRAVVVDSDDRPVAVIELTDVRVVPLGTVDLAHVVDEGEGHATYHEWRVAHEEFWGSDEVRSEVGPDFVLDDETLVVLERFKVVAVLDPPG